MDDSHSNHSDLYYAAVNLDDNGKVTTTSSRAAAVVATGKSISEAEEKCEQGLSSVKGNKLFIRHDIAKPALIKKRIDHGDYSLSLLVAIIFLVVGFVLLTKGADFFIENSATFAEEKGISPHVVGVTIVAFGTSVPELLVSLISSYQGYNDLALGNIVGSNISNIGLVLQFLLFYILLFTQFKC